jgi:hypothetical protein
VSTCEDSTNGTPRDFVERTDLAPTSPCYMGTTLPRPIRSEAEYRAVVDSVDCFGQQESGVDFSSRMLFLVVVAERPQIDVNYATLSNGVVSVGVGAHAYCGGSFPQDGILFIELDAVDAVFAERRCDIGMCSGLPAP